MEIVANPNHNFCNLPKKHIVAELCLHPHTVHIYGKAPALILGICHKVPIQGHDNDYTVQHFGIEKDKRGHYCKARQLFFLAIEVTIHYENARSHCTVDK